MPVSGQLYLTVALSPGKMPLYPLNGALRGSRNWSQRFREEKYFFLLPGIEKLLLNCPAHY